MFRPIALPKAVPPQPEVPDTRKEPGVVLFINIAFALEQPEMRAEREVAEQAIVNVLHARYTSWRFTKRELARMVHAMWSEMVSTEADNKRRRVI